MSTKNYTLTLPSDLETVLTRVFNAPRELVFKAHVDPNLIVQWWGPRQYTTTIDTFEPKAGGKWRILQKAPDGSEHAFRGEYREVTPPERIIYTFEYEPMPGHVIVEHLTFEESDGKTTLTDTSHYQSKADRDGMLSTGMEQGAAESLDRLEELLATL